MDELDFRVLGEDLFGRDITVRRRLGKTVMSGEVLPWYLSGGIPSINCIGAYRAKGAVSLAASLVNLITPGTYDLTPGASSPTWNAGRGWIYGNVGTALLDTGITVAAPTWTTIGMANTTSAGVSGAGKLFSGNGDLLFHNPSNAPNPRSYRNGGGILSVVSSLTGVHTEAIANTTVYLDGVNDGAITTGALGAGTLIIGNRTDGARQYHGDIYALAVYNVTLTLAQIISLTTAMAGF